MCVYATICYVQTSFPSLVVKFNGETVRVVHPPDSVGVWLCIYIYMKSVYNGELNKEKKELFEKNWIMLEN